MLSLLHLAKTQFGKQMQILIVFGQVILCQSLVDEMVCLNVFTLKLSWKHFIIISSILDSCRKGQFYQGSSCLQINMYHNDFHYDWAS